MTHIRLSVVIGVRNAENYILGCLSQIYAQGMQRDEFEVFVVDGMSSDRTHAIVERFTREHSATNLHWLQNPNCTLADAFNVALEHVAGTYVAKVDAQSRISKNYFRTLMDVLDGDPTIGLVGGRFLPTAQSTKGQSLAKMLQDPILVGPTPYRYVRERCEIDTVYLGIYRQSAMREVGAFDVSLLKTEDTDYNYRLRHLGWKIVLEPSVHANYYARETLLDSYRQFYGYALWNVGFRAKHRLALGVKQLLPPFWLTGLITTFVALIVLHNGWVVIPGVIYASIVLQRVIVQHHGGKHFFSAMLLYPTVHTAYAIGTTMGLIRFWRRRFGPAPLSALGRSIAATHAAVMTETSDHERL